MILDIDWEDVFFNGDYIENVVVFLLMWLE